MSHTLKQFKRPRNPSPQPWKLDVQEELDLFEEFGVNDDPTSEFLITEPDDFMDELEFEEAITAVHEMIDTKADQLIVEELLEDVDAAVERGDEQ